ncbi:hypothetical protein APR41_13050 [Salegentibacter salinarum]|uniref:Uncharacterized protein n=1 Tax=Salegentibacter salinarum TaxID=447422 RepID=A0A2N0U1S8_9FLAO|nr:hypothetical protein [Salegentibacter salinarum]PKD20954.1 hypothetical protein APR41_13050 [Salegentibacter salinarum]
MNNSISGEFLLFSLKLILNENYYFLFFLILFYSFSEDNTSVPDDWPEENNFSEEILFSEYVEGTSFNKTLEMVNLTGKIYKPGS